MSCKISPSSLSFLVRECKRCFTMKTRYGIERPEVVFPKIFNDIDLAIKKFYDGKKSTLIVPEMPTCEFLAYSVKIKSNTIVLPENKLVYHIEGECDAIVRWEDGSFGVIDYKTSSEESKTFSYYRDQMGAYSYGILHPADSGVEFALNYPEILDCGVTTNGLIVFTPKDYAYNKESQQASFNGTLKWVPSEYSEEKFLKKIKKIDQFVSEKVPPPSGWWCSFCKAYQRLYEAIDE